jgi:hypothetical protein
MKPGAGQRLQQRARRPRQASFRLLLVIFVETR